MKSKIIISDPWEYAGKILTGNIVKILNAETLIFKSDDICNFKNVNGQYFLICTRHENVNFSNKLGHIPIGGAILTCNYKNDFSEAFLLKNSIYCLIGSLDANFLNRIILNFAILFRNIRLYGIFREKSR